MYDLYNETCRECSALITNRYSTSFSLGIKVFAKEYRSPIYSIYGFVRFADEIVDTFHDKDKKVLLDRFRNETYQAIEDRISLNPVLHAFQEVVHEYGITRDLIDPFLDSMEMDLYYDNYHEGLYKTYIYGSAEVVGLMCLKVFCKGNTELYDSLKDYACSLGSAFQKVNFLRDMKSDFQERGRVYFPGIDFLKFDKLQKMEIEADIKADFDHAFIGITKLPKGARLGVYLAYVYYVNLFKKICNAPVERVMEERIRVNDSKKIYLLASSAMKHRLNLL
ncbi:MAG: phytoene/squalene synthase family protein [Bacteroidota bacterium]